MTETILSISRKPLEIELPEEGEPCAWEDFVRFGHGIDHNLSVLYQGQLYPFIVIILEEGTVFTQILRPDARPSQFDVTSDQLEGLYLTRFEAKVQGNWYKAAWPSSTSCVIFDTDGTWKYHTENDSYSYGPGASEVVREQVEALRKFTSKSFLEEYFDGKAGKSGPWRGRVPNPDVTKEMEEIVDKMVVEEIGEGEYLGYCHSFWRVKKRIFLEKYGIDWKSPAELYPTIIFD